MKKLVLTLSALVVSAGISAAQDPSAGRPNGPVMPAPGYGGYAGAGVGGHGFGFGFLSGIFSNHGGGHGARNAQMLPVATTGQLVFPQNPFIRGPRDFFMYEGR